MSSRNTVPRSPDRNSPSRSSTAPEKAPRAWPNSSLSATDAGMTAHGAVTKGWRQRLGSRRWIASATTIFPVPDSPSMRIVASLTCATLQICWRSGAIRGARVTSPSPSKIRTSSSGVGGEVVVVTASILGPCLPRRERARRGTPRASRPGEVRSAARAIGVACTGAERDGRSPSPRDVRWTRPRACARRGKSPLSRRRGCRVAGRAAGVRRGSVPPGGSADERSAEASCRLTPRGPDARRFGRSIPAPVAGGP